MQRNLQLFKAACQSLHPARRFTPVLAQSFAASNDSVTRNYIKFKTKYDQHVKAFQEKM